MKYKNKSVIQNLDKYLKDTDYGISSIKMPGGKSQKLLFGDSKSKSGGGGLSKDSKVVPYIINSIDAWDMKFQIEWAYGFKKCVQQNLLSETNWDSLMKICWDYIANTIEVAVEEEETNEDCVSVQYIHAWMELFAVLSGSVSNECLTKTVIPNVRALIDMKTKVPIRKYGVKLVLDMAMNYNEDDILTYFKGLIIYWWQDLNWSVRLAVCERLPKLISKRISKENCLEIFYPEIVEFLNDVEILVRLEAIDTILEIFDILEDTHIDNDFIPVIKSHLSVDLDETWNHRMSKNIGKIIFNLQNSMDDTSDISELWMDYFRQLLDMDDPQIKKNLCYNLPGLYYLFNGEDIDFIEVLERFATDKDTSIRMQLAKGFHEIISINSKGKGDSVELKDIFFTLLTDDDAEIQKEVLNNLDEYLMNFFRYDDGDLTPNSRDSTGTENDQEKAKNEFFNEWIEYLIRLGDQLAVRNPQIERPVLKGVAVQIPYSESAWRTKIIFYNKLIKLFDLFPQDTIKQAFWDAAKEDFLKGTEPLRRVVAVYLAKVMNSESLSEDRLELLNNLKEELEHGNFTQRRCLLEFYEASLDIFTKKFWQIHCWKGFIAFANDKIPVLRIRFAKSAMRMWQKLTKHDTDFNFKDSVLTLIDDLWEDVQEAGIELNSLITKGHDTSKEQQLEEEEKVKESLEQSLRDREVRERAEIQKRKEEEREKKEYMEMLTNQMKMKKRYLKLPGFQARLFTKESSNNKARSRKRGSFTIGNRSKTSKAGPAKKKKSSGSFSKIDVKTPNEHTRGLSFTSKEKQSPNT